VKALGAVEAVRTADLIRWSGGARLVVRNMVPEMAAQGCPAESPDDCALIRDDRLAGC
jgi:hypothetical protein